MLRLVASWSMGYRGNSDVSGERGVSFVDVIVGTSIMVAVFMALIASFQVALEYAARNRLRANALFLANEHVERIRALPYDTIGTVGGLPSGSIPQNEAITFEGQNFNRRTFIQYVDDPSDGLGAADTLAADYKRIKVELSYTYKSIPQSFSFTTTVAPPSQESLSGAGVLQILVSDALNTPLSGTTVHVTNTVVATSVDVTTFTGASGVVSFPGAWAGDGYHVTVGKPGYSSAQTYVADLGNPFPSPGPINVIVAAVSELIFKIDRLSELTVFAREQPVHDAYADTFDDVAGLATLDSVAVAGGLLVLAGTPGAYAATGQAISVPITPASLGRWLLLSFTDTLPADTEVRYRVEYDTGGGVFALVPDADLPGNALGFTDSPVALSSLDTTAYAVLRIAATLTSTNPAVTPEVDQWRLSHEEEDVPLQALPFTLRGAKTIGTSPEVYKYDATHQTDGVGQWNSTAMEWDEYTLTPQSAGYTLAEACPALPLSLNPDTQIDQQLTMVPTTANTLSVTVTETLGGVVPHAEVRITGPGVDSIRATGPCGIVAFVGLSADTYTLDIEAPGHTPYSVALPVSGATQETVILP